MRGRQQTGSSHDPDFDWLWLSIGLVLITYICKGGNWDDNLVNWDGKLE